MHGDGEHYDEFADAPEWARWKATDKDGSAWWYETRPTLLKTSWGVNEGDSERHSRPCTFLADWTSTLIERPNNKSQE